jgi:hypothetical protein
MRRPVAVAFVVASLVGLALPNNVSAASRVGEIARVVELGYLTTPEGSKSSVKAGDDVVQFAFLETEQRSWIVSKFIDNTELTVAPNAAVAIDEFVFLPGRENLTVTIGKGAMRFVSGAMKKDRLLIQTPVATIGIRGTDFSIQVLDRFEIHLWVEQGGIEVSPRANPLPVSLDAPVFAVCTDSACIVQAAPGPPQTHPPVETPGEAPGGDVQGGGGAGGEGGGAGAN